jgi:AAA domain/DnaB-like helicase N terminal domain
MASPTWQSPGAFRMGVWVRTAASFTSALDRRPRGGKKSTFATWKLPMKISPSETERAVLGSILLDERVFAQAAALSPDDFELDAHRRIYRRMCELAGTSRPIDTVTITEELARHREVEAIGGVAYLTSLTDGLPRRPNVAHYVRMIREAAGKRYLAEATDAALKHSEAGASLAELEERFAEMRERLCEYQNEQGVRITRLADIPDPFELASDGVPWLIERLIPARAITILAGEPGAGKTWLALAIAKAVKLGGEFLGHRATQGEVLYLDRENPLALVRERLEIICGGAGVLSPWGNWCADEPPLIGDPRLLDFAKQGLLIIFDSLIRFHKAENENDASEMSKIMAQLRALANAGGTVLALHHKAKSETSSYRGSSDIAGGADAVFALTKREDVLELRMVKHRFTEETSITIRPDFAAGRLEVTDSPGKMKRQDETAMLQDIITKEPGLSQRQIIERSSLPEARTRELLGAEGGNLWKTKPGPRNALLYYAL